MIIIIIEVFNGWAQWLWVYYGELLEIVILDYLGLFWSNYSLELEELRCWGLEEQLDLVGLSFEEVAVDREVKSDIELGHVADFAGKSFVDQLLLEAQESY